MKRKVLLKYLKECDCVLAREGANHSIYKNKHSGLWSAIPRHPDIEETTVLKICKQLGIPKYKK
jgi:predicted RNA binding protein YcfA (HicA-like mRNA interferase family)